MQEPVGLQQTRAEIMGANAQATLQSWIDKKSEVAVLVHSCAIEHVQVYPVPRCARSLREALGRLVRSK